MHDALPALLTLCRREFDLTARAPVYRWPCLALMLLALAVGSGEPQSAAMGVYSAHQMVRPWFGFLALFWATAAASRDRWGRTEPLILAKPVMMEGLVAARFLGSFAATVLGLTLILAAAAAGQAIAARQMPSLLALVLLVPAALPGLFYLAALGFTMSLLLRSPLAAAAAGLYWALVLLAGDYVARVFNVMLPQNGAIYALAGIGIVLLGVLLYRRSDRGRGRWYHALAIASAAGFFGALIAAVSLVARSHDLPLRQDELSLAIMAQTAEEGKRAPGFWLPDQHGARFGLHQVEDRILLLAFWSPDAPESVPLLRTLAEVQQQFGARGVTSVAVCLTEDHGVSPLFAKVDHLPFPMVTDEGTRWTASLEDSSPVGAAYETKILPVLVLTDRERRIRQKLDISVGMEKERLVPIVYALLRAEPN